MSLHRPLAANRMHAPEPMELMLINALPQVFGVATLRAENDEGWKTWGCNTLRPVASPRRRTSVPPAMRKTTAGD